MRYVYNCPKCNHTTEREYPITTAPDQVKCECGKQAQKVFVPVRFTMTTGGTGARANR
jgi:putative FmdB family regulatory protein